MAPHPLFQSWTPDEVAECLSGVEAPLYTKLWDCVPDYRCKLTPEEREEPTPGVDSLASFWDRFTVIEQAKLNELAAKQED